MGDSRGLLTRYRVAIRSAVALPRGTKKFVMTLSDATALPACLALAAWLTGDVGITAGASCPNNLIEDTIFRIFEMRGVSREAVKAV